MKILKKLAFILAIVSSVIITPSCKKEKNENSENTTPSSVDVVLAYAYNDAYCALCDANVIIVDQNGDTIVETLTTDLQDVNIADKQVNLYTKVIKITKFPASLTFTPHMTAKDLQGNYDPAYFEGEGENLKVKELFRGFAYGNNTGDIANHISLNMLSGYNYSAFPRHIETVNKESRTIIIDENGNISSAK